MTVEVENTNSRYRRNSTEVDLYVTWILLTWYTAPGITTGRRATRGNVNAGNLDVTLTCIKHCCRRCSPFHGNDIPWWPLLAAVAIKQNASGMVWGAKLVLGAVLASKFPRFQAILYWLCCSFRWKYQSARCWTFWTLPLNQLVLVLKQLSYFEKSTVSSH